MRTCKHRIERDGTPHPVAATARAEVAARANRSAPAPVSRRGASVSLGREYVKARDYGGNVSPASNTVTATSLPSNDITPPSPPNLWVWAVDTCEVLAEWTASSDDQSEPAEIRYLLFVNDEPDPTEVVMGITRTVAYGSTTGPNTFVLKAIDAAGNVSTSNPMTLDLFC